MFILAARLGKTVGELESSMDSAEFAEWFAIWRWQPWENVPEPPQKQEPLDPLAFAKSL